MRRRDLLAATAAAAAASVPGGAVAQSWPSRQITLIVPFTAGSGTDTMARLVGERLSQRLGQPVVVDNKAGASGSIAAQAAARAAPDGHTLMVTTNTTHAANPSLFKALPYDPVADFEPVALLGLAPFVLVANPALGVSDLAGLVAKAKAQPGKLTYGAGTSTATVCGETLKRLAAIDILRVPYRAAPPALNDTIAGQIDLTFIDIGTGLPHLRAGRLKALAGTDGERSPHLPEVRTLREQGLGDFELVAWYAVYAPAKTPAAVVERLNGVLNEIMTAPEMAARMDDFSVVVRLGPPARLAAFTRTEIDKWSRLVKAAGIEPEG